MTKPTTVITLLFLLMFTFPIYSQDYYWNQGEKVFVKKSDHKNYYLFFNANKTIENLEINSKRVFNKELHWTLDKFEGSELIEYVSPAVINSNNDTLNFSNLFYVRLRDEKDVELLEKMAKETNVEILGNNEFMPLWFTLSCNKNSKGNALEMANLFYESRLFSVTEVDFLIKYNHNCINNNYFNNQWNFRNIGQNGGTSGFDINLCPVRPITTGSPNIIVAVIDDGIQRNHPDLTNIHPSSYDAQTKGSSPIQGGRHGTACAGIIGANSNNVNGITGIAPGCRLMSVRSRFNTTISNGLQIVDINIQKELADAINWAWKTGHASIINASLGHRTYIISSSDLIDEAIDSALIRGRGGRGCVVVFAAGNNNAGVHYPAIARPDIIVVGAMTYCGERKRSCSNWINVPSHISTDPLGVSCDGDRTWGSNFGSQLDIVAPGDFIPTTDINGSHMLNFGGTSAAAPHIAGVAALMLSVNPNLTQKQVKNIIESTARKLPGYTYDYNNPARPNGGWNIQVGYGLVNAFEAVKKSMESCWMDFHNQTVSNTRQITGCVIDVQNVTVTPTGRLELNATERIMINGITVNPGASLMLETPNNGSVAIDAGFTIQEGAAFVIW